MAVEQNFTGWEFGDIGEQLFAGSGGARNTIQTGGRAGNFFFRNTSATSSFDVGFMPAGAIVGTSGTVSSGNHKRVSARVYFRINSQTNNGQIRIFGFGGQDGTCTVFFGAQTVGGFIQPGTKIGLRILTQSHDSGGVNPYPWGTVDLSTGVWYRLLLDVDLDVAGTTVLSATLRITDDSDSPTVDFTLSNSFNIGASDNIDKLGFGAGAITGFVDRQATVDFDDLVYIATSDADAASGFPSLPDQTYIRAIIPPTGEALNEWSGNHSDVDEYPYSGTDTVSSSTASAEVEFTHDSGLALGYASVVAMKLYINALIVGAGTGSVDYMLNGVAKNVALGITYPAVAGLADPVGGVLFSTLSSSAFGATTFGIKKQNGTQATAVANIGLEVIGELAAYGTGSQIRGDTQIKTGSIYDAQIADAAAIQRHKIAGLSDAPSAVFFPEEEGRDDWMIPGPPGAPALVRIPVVPVFFPEELADEMLMSASMSSSSTGAGGDIKSDGSVAFAADQSMGTNALTNVKDPTSPQQAATKAYVDAAVAGATAGALVQVKNTETGAVATGTTVMPFDDTIPQNTEGNEYMTLAITPTSSSHKLKIEVSVFVTVTTTPWIIVALFQDSTANALATMATFNNLSTAGMTITFTHYMTAGTTSATTFKVRIGPSSAATITFNGQSGGRIFGGVLASSITISEIIP